MAYFPEEVLEHVLTFLTSHKDRNSVSLVCKSWYRVEALSRQKAFIGNCYSVSPAIVTQRFKNLKSLSIKGKPRFSDFGLVPPDWGAYADPWIKALAEAYPWFEELRLKRMVVSDCCLSLLACSFPNFRALVLTGCEGFSTHGLIPIAANCRNLQVLELQECEIDETGGFWLSCFPDSFASLVSLNFACTKGEIKFEALERLVARCTSLKSLKLNVAVSFEQLERLLLKAPQLTDIGTGSFLAREAQPVRACERALVTCTNLKSLSGFWEVSSLCLPSLYPICNNLTFLNLSYALSIQSSEMAKLLCNCHRLQRLWVLDSIGDSGLQVVATTCKKLQELRVFPNMDEEGQASVSEVGIVAISCGCVELTSVLYFCEKMTNVGLETVAKNCPQLICFRLCILNPTMSDHLTREPLDEGFGAIVKFCTNLKRFSLSGRLTDRVFCYIGMYAKQVEIISLAFTGGSNLGMQMILEGCPKLRKLEIRDSPFGDPALLYDICKYESMRSLWMSACEVTAFGASSLAKAMPTLNVEIIKSSPSSPSNLDSLRSDAVWDTWVDKLYVYRTVVGKRHDAPCFVETC